MKTLTITSLALAALAAPAFAQPAQLKVGFPSPPTSFTHTKGMAPWAKATEAAADGTLEIKIFPGGSVVNFRNVYDRVINGVVDIGFGPTGEISDQAPRSDVSNLPFEVNNATEASVALWRLYAKGDLAADYRAVKPLNLFALPPTTVHSTKPVRTIADFRGLKIIVLNKNMGQIVTVMGGTPISLTAGESYQALDRGVADAVGMAWAGVTTFKIAEVAKHHLDVPLGAAPAMFFMNKESYARLPEKARRAIDATSGEKLSRSVGQAADESDEDGRGKTKAMSGQTVAGLDPKDAPEWRERLKPIAEQWARTAPDGAKVLAAFRAEIAAIRAGR